MASRIVHDGEELEPLLSKLRTINIPFSGDEQFGRYLDLHHCYNLFINYSKFGHPLAYTAYLDIFPAINHKAKYKIRTKQYKDYVKAVLDYLVSFMDRAHPLTFLDRMFKDLESEFETQQRMGPVRKRSREDVVEELEGYDTVESLVELGSEKLKEVLDVLGIKSGGTVFERAERVLMVKKKTSLDEIDRKSFKKQGKEEEECKGIALMEAKVNKLCDVLKETIERTKLREGNKQGMTPEELVKDRNLGSGFDDGDDDEDNDDNDDDDDDDGGMRNCKKFPLGWDGKPIPYWLYKLHGLDQEFKCEICGNYTYKGRREFERHFGGSRHQFGMRSLGIPSSKSKSFHEITLIDDAKNLWQKIQLKENESKWKPDVDEEYEDFDGNVYNKRTYIDLLKQGLI